MSNVKQRIATIEKRVKPGDPEPQVVKVYIGISPDDWPGPPGSGYISMTAREAREAGIDHECTDQS